MFKIMLSFVKSPNFPFQLCMNRILIKENRFAEFSGCLMFNLDNDKVNLLLENPRWEAEEKILKNRYSTFYYSIMVQPWEKTPLHFKEDVGLDFSELEQSIHDDDDEEDDEYYPYEEDV